MKPEYEAARCHGFRPYKWIALILFLALSACQRSEPPRAIVEPNIAHREPEAPSSPTFPAPDARVIEATASLQADPSAPDYLSIPEPILDPLQIVFPTSAPAPVSAWRPPLYPTPWVPTPQDHFYFARPIAADDISWPLADYRYGGVFLPEVVHTGIDIPSDPGTPVLAAGTGRVIWAGYGLYTGKEDINDPYGLAVAIKHDFGIKGEYLYTVYGHLDRVDVARGQHVNTGDQVGLVGQTGKVTGPHLHFEVRVGRNTFSVSRNPELWMAPPQGWGILAARIMNSSGYLLTSHPIKVISKDTGHTWTVNSYGEGAVNSDPYYKENLVLGDLPAGDYIIWVPFTGTTYDLDIHISPGMVSYFTFRGRNGFKSELPPTPVTNNVPSDVIIPTP